MAFSKKKTANVNGGFYAEQGVPCYHVDGKLVVPAGKEDYYSRIWKWKLVRGLGLEPDKLAWLNEFERKNGKITHWRNPMGDLIPL